MTLAQYISSRNEIVCTSIGTINSFSEYVRSKVNKIANFISGAASKAAIYIESEGENIINRVAEVSSSIYEQALEHPDWTFSLPTADNDPTQEIEILGSTITDSCEQMVAELRVQEQFVDYCLHSEETDANTFITRVRGLVVNAPGVIIEKFSQIIQLSGSPIECLKNFFTSITTGKFTNTNDYIELVDVASYVGNAWLAALDILAEEVTSFFQGIWKGIKKLGEFFKGLLKAIGNLTKWLFGKFFSQFLTVYDKACSAPVGIMDFPILQVTFNGQVDLANVFKYLANGNDITYSWDGDNHCIKWGSFGNDMCNNLAYSLIKNAHEEVDGTTYTSITEVVIPSEPFNISLRFGRIEAEDDPTYATYAIAMYIITDFSSVSKYTDLEIQAEYFKSFRNCLQHISGIVPLFFEYYDGESDELAELSTYTKLFFDDTYPAVQEFPLNTKAVGAYFYDLVNDYLYPADTPRLYSFFAGLLLYMLVMGKSDIRYTSDYGTDNHYNDFLTDYLYEPSTATYTQLVPVGTQYPSTGTFDIDNFNVDTFKPYSKTSLMPVTVHYQTLSDQAREVLDALKTLVIAVVTIIATVKIIKWTKMRKQKSFLAHAAVDSLSWQVADNPSSANIAKFKAAYNKARKIDVINGLLGVGDGSSSGSIFSTVGALTTSLGKVQEKLFNQGDITYDDTSSGLTRITKLIKGDS